MSAYVRPPLVISSPTRSGVRSPTRSLGRSPSRSHAQPQFESPNRSPVRSPIRAQSPPRSPVRSTFLSLAPSRRRSLKSQLFAERTEFPQKVDYLYPTEASIEQDIKLSPKQENIYQYIKHKIPQLYFERLGTGYDDELDYSRFLAQQRIHLSELDDKFISMLEGLVSFSEEDMLKSFNASTMGRIEFQTVYGFYFSQMKNLVFLTS